MTDQVVKAIGAAVVGAALTWVTTSLTLVGRVEAIEKTLGRMEAFMYSGQVVKVGK